MLRKPIERPVALVTGAGRNIGRAIAMALAVDGFSIAVNVSTSAEEGRSVVAELQALGAPALLCMADVTDHSAVHLMVDSILSQWGRLDVLVNNAAVRHEAPFAGLALPDWQRTLSVVLDGAFLCSQAASPFICKSSRGAIVNIGGLTGHTGAKDRVHVVTAKAGLVGLTKALAHDLADAAVTVNCVSPGMISTNRKLNSASAKPAHHAVHHPLLPRRGTAEEVAAMVSWLASDHARFVTGQVLHVNGGAHLGS